MGALSFKAGIEWGDEQDPDAVWFREALVVVGHTQASFARWMKEHGDIRPVNTVARSIRRMANGDARVSAEIRVILRLMNDGLPK